jgi:hypothetical protein
LAREGNREDGRCRKSGISRFSLYAGTLEDDEHWRRDSVTRRGGIGSGTSCFSLRNSWIEESDPPSLFSKAYGY